MLINPIKYQNLNFIFHPCQVKYLYLSRDQHVCGVCARIVVSNQVVATLATSAYAAHHSADVVRLLRVISAIQFCVQHAR